MKSIKYLTIVLFAVLGIAVALTACNKEDAIAKKTTETPEPQPQLLVGQSPADIFVECIGSCSNGNDCAPLVRDGVIVCGCSGCVLSITEENPSNRSTDSKVDLSKLLNHYVNYVNETHNTEIYGIIKFQHSFYDNAEFILITYFINGNPEVTYSVSYLIEYDSSDINAAPKTTLIDCSGSCPGDTCVEHYNMNTGDVKCGCQSDNCVMTIEEVQF